MAMETQVAERGHLVVATFGNQQSTYIYIYRECTTSSVTLISFIWMSIQM